MVLFSGHYHVLYRLLFISFRWYFSIIYFIFEGKKNCGLVKYVCDSLSKMKYTHCILCILVSFPVWSLPSAISFLYPFIPSFYTLLYVFFLCFCLLRLFFLRIYLDLSRVKGLFGRTLWVWVAAFVSSPDPDHNFYERDTLGTKNNDDDDITSLC